MLPKTNRSHSLRNTSFAAAGFFIIPRHVPGSKKDYGSYTSLPFEEAGPLTETVLIGNLAVLSYNYSEKDKQRRPVHPGRKKLFWDGENMRITNFEPANRFVKREYRKGWQYPLSYNNANTYLHLTIKQRRVANWFICTG